MENPADDATIKRWQEAERIQQDGQDGNGSRKRPRKAIEYGLAESQQNDGQTKSAGRGGRSVREATVKRNVGTKLRDQTYLGMNNDARIYELLSE